MLLEGCNICVTAMSHFIRQLTTKNVAPVAVAATTTVTKSCQTRSLRHTQVTDMSTQTTGVIQAERHCIETPSGKTATYWKEPVLERTPKSRVHQELLRKKRQRDAVTQTEFTEAVQDKTDDACNMRRKLVRYRRKAAAQKARANKLQRKYNDSVLARQSLAKLVAAIEKTAEQRGSPMELAYQEQTSALRVKCEAMFASFEEVRAAHQSKVHEHESLQVAHERLKTQHDSTMNQVSRLSPWMKLLEGDAGEWQQLRQTHSIFYREATTADDDCVDYQEEEAMIWTNHIQIDEEQALDAQAMFTTLNAAQSFTSAMTPQAALASMDAHGCQKDEAGLEDEETAATKTIPTANAAGKNPEFTIGSHVTNAVEVDPVVQASTKVKVSDSRSSPLFWRRQLVPEDYYDARLANDAEEYPHATTWDVHASICLEVGSDEDGRPRYFRFVPQVATPEAGRIVPGLLNECQQKLMQYVHNGLAILAGLQVPSGTECSSPQFHSLPLPDKPIWLRRGRKELPSVKPGARQGWVSKTSDIHNDSESLENPFDAYWAFGSSFESPGFAYNA